MTISARLTLGQKSKSQVLTSNMAFTLRCCLWHFGDNHTVNQDAWEFVLWSSEGWRKCLLMRIPRSVCMGSLWWVEAPISYEMVAIPLSLRSGATLSKLRWTQVGLRNQKNRPLTHFLFQAAARLNPHRCDDVGNSRIRVTPSAKSLLSHRHQDEVSHTLNLIWHFEIMTSDTWQQIITWSAGQRFSWVMGKDFLVLCTRKTKWSVSHRA